MQPQVVPPVVVVEKTQQAADPRLPPAVIEKQIKVSNYSNSTSSALAAQLENSVRLLQGYCVKLHYCNEVIEGALLTLGVQTTHSLISSITAVVEGLDVVAGVYRGMCDSHWEEIRQREDLFASLCSTYFALKERQEATERDLRGVIAERDHKNATFDKVVSYVETVLAERAIWQEQVGYNPSSLPLMERSFTQRCHETLENLDEILQETRNLCVANVDPILSSTESPSALVKRWEAIEDMRYINGIPSARVQYVPPKDEVELLREVLDMGTGSRVLLHDVQEERRTLEELKRNTLEIAVKSLAALQSARTELSNFKKWLVSLEQQGHPFNTSFETFRSMMTEVDGKMTTESVRRPILSNGK